MSNAFLITWNPKKWDFEGGFSSFLQRVTNGEKPVEPWTVCSSSIQKGDVLYLMKLGGEPRGIIAKGISIDDVHMDKHYDAELAKTGVETKHVTVQFIEAKDYTDGDYLRWDMLKERFPGQNWTPQASGIRIKDEYIHELDNMWSDSGSNDLLLSDIKHNLAIIKINKSYYDGISPRELYEYTRGFWKRKIESVKDAQYALSVYKGVVIEVYKIDKWIRASQADNIIREYDPNRHADRIAFDGSIAPEAVRTCYIGKNVASLYKNGEADPVKIIIKGQDNSIAGDINVPRRPKKIIRKQDGTVQYRCSRCDTLFLKAARCPDCGQLIEE